MKRSVLFIFFLFFTVNILDARPACSKQLLPVLEKLYALKETRSLLEFVESHGPFSIQAVHSGKNNANASWHCDQRAICINFSNPRSQGSLIRSVIFELCNASNQKDFDHLDTLASRRMISKNNYIRAVERVEHQHALQAVALLNKGITQQIFPEDSRWPISENFEEHFMIQLQAGHAQQIGVLYDSLSRAHA